MTHYDALVALFKCQRMVRAALVGGDFVNPKAERDLRHCLDMIERAKGIPAGRVGKAMRWLGFVQGVMFAHGLASIEELKAINRAWRAGEPDGAAKGDME